MGDVSSKNSILRGRLHGIENYTYRRRARNIYGLAFGIFYLLLKAFNFQFSQIDATWTAVISVLFLLIIFAITLVALHYWRPTRNPKQTESTMASTALPTKRKRDLNLVKDVTDEEFSELVGEIEGCLRSDVLSKHEHYDAYISCPMASCDQADRENMKSDLSRLIVSLHNAKLRDIECPAAVQTDTNEYDKFDDPEDALKLCFKRILFSKRFILVYPKTRPSSSIFEVGLAMAFCKPITIFLKKGVDLPFLLQKIDHRLENAHIYTYDKSIE